MNISILFNIFRTSICGEVIVVDHILTRCCSRASNAESINGKSYF